MTKKTKLELTWPGKEERPKLEPRILIEHPEKSYHAATRREGNVFDNMLIKGDNLLALKALEADYAGTVKCVFIDPPYNTGSAFDHYDDGLEHSIWLSMMRGRLELIHRLLAENGSLWVTLDDNEAHYFKVMCDGVFGRSNFIATVIWQKIFSPKNSARHLSEDHDYVLVYAKNADAWHPNKMERSERQAATYKNPDNDPRGPWTSGDLSARNAYGAGVYPITTPSGRVIAGPPNGMYWRVSEPKLREMDADGRIWWGKDGNGTPRIKRFLSEVSAGVVPQTLWLHTEVGNTQEAKKEVVALFGSENFLTPKPERLLQRVIHLASNPGDLIIDSFAGSGTTGAVAHKMGRRWIMVEIGDHADTHIVPRLQKVIDGTDQGGISKAVDWKGGGGFRYYTLAPSLLEKDRWGNWVIAREYNAAMLAEAMCKHLGFTYAPSQDEAEYWRHGQSSETDFLYVTTQSLTHEALRLLSEEVGPHRTLMICAKAFSGNLDAFANLTCRKIPSTILTKCEWGRDDYSLNVAALPEAGVAEARADQPESAGPLFDVSGQHGAGEEQADG